MDYRSNIILVLGEGPTDDIKDRFCTAKKKFSINFTKQVQNSL